VRVGGVARLVLRLAAALPLLAGCASAGGRHGMRPEEEVTLVVQNDLLPRGVLTVRVLAQSGRQVAVAAVTPGSTQRLRVAQPAFVGMYRLRAEPDGGRAPVLSTPFTLSSGLVLVWAVQANSLRSEYPVAEHL
jgi:hypothetical protein